MQTSYTLIRLRRYKEAHAKATKECAGKSQDKRSSMLFLGESLILLGRYREAQEHFEKQAKEYRFLGSRVGYNFTYAGIANWFQAQREKSIRLWEEGLKAGYQSGDGGMEIPWVMLYAAGRYPECISRANVEQLIRMKSKRLYHSDSPLAISQFALGIKTYDEIVAELPTLHEGKYAEYQVMIDRSLVDFIAGVHALFDQNVARFYEQMVACASITGHSSPAAELIIAECEIRHGPPKWKRRFAKWLRENVCPNGKPKKSRGKTSRP